MVEESSLDNDPAGIPLCRPDFFSESVKGASVMANTGWYCAGCRWTMELNSSCCSRPSWFAPRYLKHSQILKSPFRCIRLWEDSPDGIPLRSVNSYW